MRAVEKPSVREIERKVLLERFRRAWRNFRTARLCRDISPWNGGVSRFGCARRVGPLADFNARDAGAEREEGEIRLSQEHD